MLSKRKCLCSQSSGYFFTHVCLPRFRQPPWLVHSNSVHLNIWGRGGQVAATPVFLRPFPDNTIQFFSRRQKSLEKMINLCCKIKKFSTNCENWLDFWRRKNFVLKTKNLEFRLICSTKISRTQNFSLLLCDNWKSDRCHWSFFPLTLLHVKKNNRTTKDGSTALLQTRQVFSCTFCEWSSRWSLTETHARCRTSL